MMNTFKKLSVAASLVLAANAFAQGEAAKPAAGSPATTPTQAAKAGETTTTMARREIDFSVVKKDDGIHWEPETVTIHPGEHLRFVVKYDMPGGAEFHGFTIAELGVAEKIDRNKTKTLDVDVPANLKAGEIKVVCQFHPAHHPSKIEVVPGSGPTPQTTEGVTAPPAADQADKTVKPAKKKKK